MNGIASTPLSAISTQHCRLKYLLDLYNSGVPEAKGHNARLIAHLPINPSSFIVPLPRGHAGLIHVRWAPHPKASTVVVRKRRKPTVDEPSIARESPLRHRPIARGWANRRRHVSVLLHFGLSP